jgi:hypothetical protein
MDGKWKQASYSAALPPVISPWNEAEAIETRLRIGRNTRVGVCQRKLTATSEAETGKTPHYRAKPAWLQSSDAEPRRNGLLHGDSGVFLDVFRLRPVVES